MEYAFIGADPLIQKIRELMDMVSDTAFNVLILGETGTGKEVVARLLHQSSNRRKQKFIKINCSALPLTLLESELFGYEKGAFTGAVKAKPGKFELASGGVVFLDEIGDMPILLQAKLLEVIQSGEFNRLGGTEDVKVNTWVVSATNHDLAKDIQDRTFREDLYYRLNIIKIEIPPLRERRGDIPLLIDYFVKKHSLSYQLSDHMEISPYLNELFQTYHWPGNLRELSSVVLRLMIGDDPEIIRSELERNFGNDHPDDTKTLNTEPLIENGADDPFERVSSRLSLKKLKAEASGRIERKTILEALNRAQWNKRRASEILQISYKSLFNKIKEYGIETKQM
ncbi:MAG: sigma-54 dependent transcriptional regulator [Thermodesulfobacteriota bacterium]|nr:sigma-54 dependent transcriptional regulator [Thermodesulfobacteriota bacterium]